MINSQISINQFGGILMKWDFKLIITIIEQNSCLGSTGVTNKVSHDQVPGDSASLNYRHTAW